jgi:hypothetical protein
MTINDAVAFLRAYARNGDDSSMYTAFKCEAALASIGNDFVQRTQCTRTTGDLALNAGVDTLPSLSALTGFQASYLTRATLIGVTGVGGDPNLAVVDYGTVLNLLTNEARIAQPRLIGFDGPTTGRIYPTTDIAYTLRLAYIPPFTAWTLGSGGTGTLNIPDEHLQQIIRWGATYFLQGNEPENKIAASNNWKNYLDYVARVRGQGIGTLGKQIEYRNPHPGRTVKTLTDTFYH